MTSRYEDWREQRRSVDRLFDRGLGLALLYSLALLLLTFVTFVTDMPGYVYVPGFFALSTCAALLLLAGRTAAFRLLRPAAPHSEPPAA